MPDARPSPNLPAYSGANVRGILPALLAPRRAAAPPWFPQPAVGASRYVLLVLDGLGWDQLSERRHLAPTLAGMAGGPITTVAPTTTATALTSITTGLTPGEHGLVGYRMEVAGQVLNVLRWWTSTGDARRTIEPARTQPFEPFLGERVPVVSKAELEGSAFTEAHLRGGVPRGWRSPSSLPVTVAGQLAAGERVVYAYYDGIDKIAHERGFGAYYDAELVLADRLVADLIALVPADTAVLVTADHGQVHVGDRSIEPALDLLRMVRVQSGEGRFRWLHAKAGAGAELLAAAHEQHSGVAWVVSREQVIDEGWFGPVVSPPVAARLGDVALVPFEPITFHDPADSGPFPLVCRHGSLTSAEIHVPLLVSRR